MFARQHIESAALLVLAVVLAPVMSGCAGPGPQSGDTDPIRQSACPIVKVVCFFEPTPRQFKSFDPEGDPNPEGFACTLYLVSRETGKGVHVNGTLHVYMYRLDPTPDHGVERTLACDWSQPLNQLPRSKRPSMMGWGYAPRFHWAAADVLGSQVEIFVVYESPEGHKVRSVTHSFKIPSRKL